MEFSTMKIDEELWEMCVMKSNNRKCNYEKCTLWSLIIESVIMLSDSVWSVVYGK